MDSPQAALFASTRADRLEYCADLRSEGLTPNMGELRELVDSSEIPVFSMIRPRPGDFVHAEHELATMERSIEEARDAGAQGVVLGVLNDQNEIEVHAMRRLLRRCEGLEVTFHRAFDGVVDKLRALEILMDLGLDRLLTTGGPASAWEGREMLRDLVSTARERLIVLPGGGVRQDHVHALLEFTGAREVHSSQVLDLAHPTSGE